MNKESIKNIKQSELQNLCLHFGEPKYKADQIYEWIFKHGISSYDQMLNIKKTFRKQRPNRNKFDYS